MGLGRLGAIGVSFMIVLLSTALAEAYEVSTGPVRVVDRFDGLECVAANVANANINNVVITVRLRRVDGSSNGAGKMSCGTLGPDETCQAPIIAETNDYAAFCQVTYPSGKIRATFCNVTHALCSDAH